MITLPLHGHDTAAVKIITGQARPLILGVARGDVFGKQAKFLVAEFLFNLLIFLNAPVSG